ncbi:MAG: bacteriocin [Coriobacteriia bacterium]|nr:bacteriocin [Coriobacteriia bacterium]
MGESICEAVMSNKELLAQLLEAQREAAKEGMPADQMADAACQIINAAGIGATKEDAADLLAKAGSAQLSDKELDSVSGGCCDKYCPRF